MSEHIEQGKAKPMFLGRAGSEGGVWQGPKALRTEQGKLLPCPFCGGEPHRSSIEGIFFVRCYDCNAGINTYDTQEEADKHWNTRQPPQDSRGDNLKKVLAEGLYDLIYFKEKPPSGKEVGALMECQSIINALVDRYGLVRTIN